MEKLSILAAATVALLTATTAMANPSFDLDGDGVRNDWPAQNGYVHPLLDMDDTDAAIGSLLRESPQMRYDPEAALMGWNTY